MRFLKWLIFIGVLTWPTRLSFDFYNVVSMAQTAGLSFKGFSRSSLPSSRGKRRLILWNVGQGQWVTRVSENACEHFDLGGEHFPKEFLKECGAKKNYVSLTHWDQDHTSFAVRVLKSIPKSCIYHLPLGEHKMKKWLLRYRKCDDDLKDVAIHQPPHINGRSNDNSSSFILDDRVLITGDLSKGLEKVVFRNVSLESIRIYVAGHHGSQTSSSDFLLRKMRSPLVSLASARKAKYGHPHKETLVRLRQYHSTILTTENWGHIKIEY